MNEAKNAKTKISRKMFLQNFVFCEKKICKNVFAKTKSVEDVFCLFDEFSQNFCIFLNSELFANFAFFQKIIAFLTL